MMKESQCMQLALLRLLLNIKSRNNYLLIASIIGHHACIDFSFLMQNFIGDLPSTFEEYSYLVHNYFPIIFDSKLIAV